MMIENNKQTKNIKNNLLKTGMNFDELNCGTNAIHLSMLLKHSFYTSPEQHFCDFLKDWYIFSIPIEIQGNIECCLSLISKENCINQEVAVIMELVAYKFKNELLKRKREYDFKLASSIKLTKRQLEILRALAKGNTDMSVALELGISISTVRYHKTNIFKLFNSESCIQIILKALKLGFISIEDIYV